MGRWTLPGFGAALLFALATASSGAAAETEASLPSPDEAQLAFAVSRWAFERDVEDYADARTAAPIGAQVPFELDTSIALLRDAHRKHPQNLEIQRALAFALSVDHRLGEAAAVLGGRPDPKLEHWFRCAAGAAMRPVPRYGSKSVPTYPEAERLERVQGRAVVQLVIEPDGTVTCGRVLSATRTAFAAAALETVRHWRYVPLSAGDRTRETGIVIINYQLE